MKELKRFIEFYININYQNLSLEDLVKKFKNNSCVKDQNNLLQEVDLIKKKAELDGEWSYHLSQGCGLKWHRREAERFIKIMHGGLVQASEHKNKLMLFIERYVSKNTNSSLREKLFSFTSFMSQKEKAKFISLLQSILKSEAYDDTVRILKEQTDISMSTDEIKQLVIESLRLLV